MKVFIVDKKRLTKYDLPPKMEENFSISYLPNGALQESLITFESNGKLWYLKSNGTVNIVNQSGVINQAPIEEYHHYFLKIVGVDGYLTLFVLPTFKEQIFKVDIQSANKIIIGNDSSAQIIYRHPMVTKNHAVIVKKEGGFELTSLPNFEYPVFVNNKRVKRCFLKNGDMIFIAGLKIIWMGKFVGINNPNNLVSVSGFQAYYEEPSKSNNEFTPVTEDERNVELYQENDYFYHIPRIQEIVEEKEYVIDPPPQNQNPQNRTWLLTLGSSLTMLAGTFVTGFNVYDGLVVQKRDWVSVLPQIIMLIAMLVGSLVIPRLVHHLQAKHAKKMEKLRQEKYTAYLNEKREKLTYESKNQAQILTDNFPNATACKKIVENKERFFWAREVRDEDFLTIRLGLGKIENNVKITAPEEHFSLETDNLLQDVYQLVDDYEYVTNVPITINLREKNITSLICKCSYEEDYINGIITQLVTLHSPSELKIVVLTNEENASRWEYIKYLPHVWSEDRENRFFATDIEEAKEVSSILEEEFKQRISSTKAPTDGETENKKSQAEPYLNFSPYYLIINDDYRIGKNTQIINDIVRKEENFGFSLLVISESMKLLPSNCQSFIEVGERDGAIMETNLTSKNQKKFTNEYDPTIDMSALGRTLSNIPMYIKNGLLGLPSTISFLEMCGVSKIEQMNIFNRWQTSNPVLSLSTPIGVQEDGELFKLNLHEKAHGPHGLIAGSTGSGKSEFIITYILSMATHFHPYEVQFVLIDYKGGGLAGAFENKETGVRLPHLIGTITNLDTNEMNRTLVSIESELKRRQRIFNETRDALGEGTIDIYKYQRLYREGLVKEPLAHLFIISDEFAELKSQQPEFMSQLISTSRIGRSLGVHLILATQKPSGVVNEQIWSNSKFKICLKVQSRSDSMEMLKRPEAASIKETGRFYLQVGYDDLFEIGQSAWAGAKYVPSDRIVRKIDDSIDFVNDTGLVIKSIKDVVKTEPTKDYGEQLTNIVKYLYDLGKRTKVTVRKMWLDPIPAEIYLQNLKQKYPTKTTPYVIAPMIGEYDNPAMQEQGPAILDLTNFGNTVIYGMTGSGKENLITTILWSSIIEHTPSEVNFYILEFGSESLKVFRKMPHVGEVVTIDEKTKIIDTLEMLREEIEYRRELFADYAGSYVEYCKNSGNKLPLIVTIINGYDVFSENYANIAEGMLTMYRDGSKYGVIFIVTAVSPSAIRPRMAQNFENVICLQLSNDTAYRDLTGSPRGLTPSKFFGRGIIKMETGAFEFQTALFAPRKDIANTLRIAAEKLSTAYTVKAKKVLSIPDYVTVDLMKDKVNGLSRIPLGIDLKTKKEALFSFTGTPFTPIITHSMSENKTNFLYGILKLLKCVPNIKITVIDFVNAYEKEVEGIRLINHDFDQALIQVNNEIVQSKDSSTQSVYMVLGAGELNGNISSDSKLIINRLFSSMNLFTNTHFLLVDTYPSYKNLQTTEWYQAVLDSNHGVWLGNGIGAQTAIHVSNLTMEERQLDFLSLAYLVEKGNVLPIKHLVDMEEENEE